MLWPLELHAAEYQSRGVATADVPEVVPFKSVLRLHLRATAGLTFQQLALDRLPLYLPNAAAGATPIRLYELLLAGTAAVVVRPPGPRPSWFEVIDRSSVRRVGFEDDQALLPIGSRSFHGYRLLQEYFAFPERFLFVELAGLTRAVRRCSDTELEILVLFDRSDAFLENSVLASHFKL
jgi:type VI secretion system protein ImpG